MKETINANNGGRVCTLDRDAYDRLTIYLNDLRRRIATDTDEVMDDIEARLAEILHEGLPSQMMVVGKQKPRLGISLAIGADINIHTVYIYGCSLAIRCSNTRRRYHNLIATASLNFYASTRNFNLVALAITYGKGHRTTAYNECGDNCE